MKEVVFIHQAPFYLLNMFIIFIFLTAVTHVFIQRLMKNNIRRSRKEQENDYYSKNLYLSINLCGFIIKNRNYSKYT